MAPMLPFLCMPLYQAPNRDPAIRSPSEMKGCQKDVERESLGVQSLVGVEASKGRGD